MCTEYLAIPRHLLARISRDCCSSRPAFGLNAFSGSGPILYLVPVCARFTLTADSAESVAAAFGVPAEELPPWQARFNIAPTDEHLVVRMRREDREALSARWGLVRYGSKDRKRAARGINARAESVGTRPLFREAFRKRRCIVPADGYYEWTGPKEQRQPFWFHRPNGELLAFAGLYEWWRPAPDAWEATFTILTCPPNALAGRIHDRMPVILPEEHIDGWLLGGEREEALTALLGPTPEDYLVARPVSQRVNSVRNDGPDLIAELTAESGEQAGLFGGT